MDYKRINNITGWVVFGIALLVYVLTMAPTASFWDCGEFIACANELEVPHPPGAPFFLLIGRIFAMLSFGGPNQVGNIAWMLNFMSALSSAFTVLFTFWITTHLARKMVGRAISELTRPQIIAIMASGVVAGLANTFADSFWFNAVEAEVYALSSFFTAVVVWLMFKWENYADQPGNERWIILITYLMGLSIGVHLLNLLTIPALAYIYYFRKYDFSWGGFILTGAISVGVLGLVQTGIILYTFDIAWWLERSFTTVVDGKDTSGLGMPLNSGTVIFAIFLIAGIVGGLFYSHRAKNLILNLALLGVVMIYIGLGSYAMVRIRSNADSPIDENNPENSQTFLSYMKREQYGDRPLIKGPLYNARPYDYETLGNEYVLKEGPGGEKWYEVIGEKKTYKYRDNDQKWFPRMYARDRYDMGPYGYKKFVKNLGKDKNNPDDDRPTAGEDLRFFFVYQVGHMYWRYFMWNFVGKESDIQDEKWEGGWEFSKISKMPDFIKNQPSKNHYFALPFLLGLLGIIVQIRKRGSDAAVVGMLFFFTGLAIIIWLNQYPMQPRERDYSFAGSFQTFAIWIGLGVFALYDLLEKALKGTAVYIAAGVGLIPVILMGVQNWDDHSRAGRYIAPESAYNLLNSLAPNAVLFTNGDNDTFPLWYIQEVENVRTDVRVLCLSYVNTDWYIDQMKQKMNQSEPLPLSLKRDDYVGQKNQSRSVRGALNLSLPSNGQELVQKGIISDQELNYVQSPMSWRVPARGPKGRQYLELKDVLILDLLQNVAKNGWERPVYFANTVSPSAFLGLDKFFRLEGLAYRILPVDNTPMKEKGDPYFPKFPGAADLDRMYENMIKKFRYTNLDNPDVYYDENILRMLSNYHATYHRLVNGHINYATYLENQNVALKDSMANNEGNEEMLSALQSLVDQNQAKADTLKSRAVEVMMFRDERMPYQAVTPPLYLISQIGVLYERLGMRENAEEAFEFAKDRAIATIKYYKDIGVSDGGPQSFQNMYPLQLLQRHYVTTGQQEKLQELTDEMQSLGLN
ncbi:MAG: DUF2723 domain-containing protein [Bacteroidia bacterium]|nr:DUF2723 domain-containing protein [Bacteroidia bacterium]